MRVYCERVGTTFHVMDDRGRCPECGSTVHVEYTRDDCGCYVTPKSKKNEIGGGSTMFGVHCVLPKGHEGRCAASILEIADDIHVS